MSGQTDYGKISSPQGPCYYPAGHLWHYSPIYYMYLWTDQAEIYHKFIHLFLHSINMTVVVTVAYKYFKNDYLKPQLICFLLLANEEARELN